MRASKGYRVVPQVKSEGKSGREPEKALGKKLKIQSKEVKTSELRKQLPLLRDTEKMVRGARDPRQVCIHDLLQCLRLYLYQ